MVERVRRARAAAEKKMNAFSGNLADYTLFRRIVGQKSTRDQAGAMEQPSPADTDRQSKLNFVGQPPDREPSR